MVDVFDYNYPFGFIGKIADLLFLRRYMGKFVRKRAGVIKAAAEQLGGSSNSSAET